MFDGLRVASIVVAVCACLAAGSCVTRKIDDAEIARIKEAHAQEISKINAAAAQAYAALLAQKQALSESIDGLAQAYAKEKSQHEEDNSAYRRKLLAGTERVRVRIANCNTAAADQSAGPASGPNAAATVAELPRETAASVVAVADNADDVARRLAGLQAYVRQLQEKGVIEK